MNKIIIACALLAVVSADFVVKKQADLEKIRGECVKLHKITPEQVEQYKKWNFTEVGHTPCYIKCVFNKMDLFDDEKGFLVSSLILLWELFRI